VRAFRQQALQVQERCRKRQEQMRGWDCFLQKERELWVRELPEQELRMQGLRERMHHCQQVQKAQTFELQEHCRRELQVLPRTRREHHRKT
jgi:hypothetical protein